MYLFYAFPSNIFTSCIFLMFMESCFFGKHSCIFTGNVSVVFRGKVTRHRTLKVKSGRVLFSVLGRLGQEE